MSTWTRWPGGKDVGKNLAVIFNERQYVARRSKTQEDEDTRHTHSSQSLWQQTVATVLVPMLRTCSVEPSDDYSCHWENPMPFVFHLCSVSVGSLFQLSLPDFSKRYGFS